MEVSRFSCGIIYAMNENDKDEISLELDKMFSEEEAKSETTSSQPKQTGFGRECVCGKSKKFPMCDGSHVQ
jgi:hypothetical protein